MSVTHTLIQMGIVSILFVAFLWFIGAFKAKKNQDAELPHDWKVFFQKMKGE